MSDSVSPTGGAPVETELLNRRSFVALAMGGAGACYAVALGYPVYKYLASPVETSAAAAAVTEVTLKDAQKLAAGTALMFKFGTKPALLIHHKDDTWVALDAVCTHLACTVQYDPAGNRITCACHGGVYDSKTGQNIGGPPPKPLKQYRVTVSDTGVQISRG